MTVETFQPLDLDIVPNPGAPYATLLQSQQDAFLIFLAIRREAGRKRLEEFIAVFKFETCTGTRFGYPNEDPRVSIPRYENIPADIVEVMNSEWAAEVQTQNQIGFPNYRRRLDRHLLFQFKDSTFECLCDGFEVELTTDPWGAVTERFLKRLN